MRRLRQVVSRRRLAVAAAFAVLGAAGPFAAVVVAQPSGRSTDNGYRPACKTCNSTTEEQPPTTSTTESTTTTTMTTTAPPPPPPPPPRAVTPEMKADAQKDIHAFV